jgi:peptidoglycan/LPS O-acetylase OafA/YrhL
MFEGDSALKRLPVTDGLRAVAVIAVVLFHLFPRAAPGGYIGVDVFFVISGFVIALRYLPRLVAREVRFRDFFARRIQRLVPAYLVVLVATTIAAYLILEPVDLKNYGDSLAGQAAYAQNVVFWLQGDYFEDALHKPLLHTWSLAVEEQFYLCFPILVLVFRRGRVWGTGALLLAALGSLAVGMMLAGISPKTAFYLLPTRVWEFAAGIATALVFGRISAGRASGPVFLLGLAAILFATFGFSEAARFPGPHAFLAVGATVAICLVQRDLGGRLASLLANPVAQHFGRISYSWYLWHWPIVALRQQWAQQPATTAESVAMLLAGYALAAASYRLVERPALDRKALRRGRNSLALLGGFLGLALACGLYLSLTKGALGRFPPERRALFAATMDRVPNRCSFAARLAMYDAQVCRLAAGSGEAVLLLGDSHADFMKYELTALARSAGDSLYLTKQDCRPIDFGIDYNCGEAVWQAVKADVRRLGIGKIVVIARWERSVTADQYRRGVERMLETGATIYLQRVVPNARYFNPILRARGLALPPPYTASDYARDYAVETATLDSLAAASGGRLRILDPVPLLCPGGGACALDTGGEPNYIDDDHLSTAGRRRVAPLYREVFRRPA